MHLTDEEFSELHNILDNYVRYGDDVIVYGSEGDLARSILRKVEDEAKARGFWWAR